MCIDYICLDAYIVYVYMYILYILYIYMPYRCSLSISYKAARHSIGYLRL